MNIAIEAHTLEIESWSGKEQYLFSLLQNLPQDENKYFIYLRRSVKKVSDLSVIRQNIFIKNKKLPTPLWQIWALCNMKLNHVNRVLAPCSYLLSAINPFFKMTIIIHDLMAFLNISKNTHKISLRLKEWFTVYISCKLSHSIIAISENTKSDLIREFKIKKDKINVVHQGIRFSVNKNTELSKSEQILSVGTIEARKNIETIVLAFEELKKNHSNINWKLKIVGKIGWKMEKILDTINNSKFKEDIKMLGYLSDEDLKKTYKESLCLVYPSIYEGFGLPPLEAMSQGCPVIVSNSSSLPEVVDSAGILINTMDYKSIANNILDIYNNDSLRESLKNKGYEQAAKFSWQKAAREIVEIAI